MDTKLLKKEDLDLDVAEEDEDILIMVALTTFLEDEGEEGVDIERSYPNEDRGYNSHLYTNNTTGAEYLVCSYDEAEQYAREDLESLIDDLGPIEAFGEDYCEYYLEEDYFDDMLRDDCEYRVDDMDEDELIEEMESRGIIDDDDKIPVDEHDFETEESDDEEDREYGYDPHFIEGKKDELIESMVNDYNSGIDYFYEIYGHGELAEYVKNNPECIDIDGMIQNILDNDGFGPQLARYDSEEHEINYEDEFGSTKYLYVYRVD